jgi:predicted Zn-dependent peptidase
MLTRTACLLALLAACHSGPAAQPAMIPTTGDVAPMTPPPPPPTQVPAADPAPKTEGAYTEAWVHGAHVLVKRIPGAETTATEIAIRGGVRNWTKADAGIERLALATAISGGTESMPKDAFTKHLSELGSSLDSSSGEDFSSVSAWCLTPTWDETFRMLTDAFRHPALPADELEVQRQAQLAALHQEQDDPDSKLRATLYATMYKGQPYENRALGNLEAVKALNAAQLRTHLEQLRETSRLMVVVVGDVDPQKVIGAVGTALGDLPRGAYTEQPLPPFHSDHGSLTVVEQKLPTNYILAVTPGPRWNDPDFYAMWVGMGALHTREFKEVRTKRNLSYAPAAFMRLSGEPMIGLYVTAVDPITTMGVMLGEAKRLRDEPLPADELEAGKAQLLTETMMGTQSPMGQVGNLAVAQMLGGDWRLLNDLPGHVKGVTAAQIQAWAAKHFTHLQTVVLGDPSKLDRKALESF